MVCLHLTSRIVKDKIWNKGIAWKIWTQSCTSQDPLPPPDLVFHAIPSRNLAFHVIFFPQNTELFPKSWFSCDFLVPDLAFHTISFRSRSKWSCVSGNNLFPDVHAVFHVMSFLLFLRDLLPPSWGSCNLLPDVMWIFHAISFPESRSCLCTIFPLCIRSWSSSSSRSLFTRPSSDPIHAISSCEFLSSREAIFSAAFVLFKKTKNPC